MHISNSVFRLIFINIFCEGKRDNNIKKRKNFVRDIGKNEDKTDVRFNKNITFC
jgi:hypothetical protein